MSDAALKRIFAAMHTAETADDLVEVCASDLVEVLGVPTVDEADAFAAAGQNLYCDCNDDPWTATHDFGGEVVRVHHGSRTAERREGFNQLALAVAMQALYRTATGIAVRMDGAIGDCERIELALVSMAWEQRGYMVVCQPITNPETRKALDAIVAAALKRMVP